MHCTGSAPGGYVAAELFHYIPTVADLKWAYCCFVSSGEKRGGME